MPEKYNKMKIYTKGYMDALEELNNLIFFLKDDKKNFEILEVTISSKVELFNTLMWIYDNYGEKNED